MIRSVCFKDLLSWLVRAWIRAGCWGGVWTRCRRRVRVRLGAILDDELIHLNDITGLRIDALGHNS